MNWIRRALLAVSLTTGLALGLVQPTTAAPPVNLDECPLLAEGYRGGCVSELQIQLNMIQDPDVAVDGRFGAKTEESVMAFQIAKGLKPDGIVGKQTKAALGDELSVPTPSPGPRIQEVEVQLPEGQQAESLSDPELAAKCMAKTALPSAFKLLRRATAGSLPETEALIKVTPGLDAVLLVKCILWDNPNPLG